MNCNYSPDDIFKPHRDNGIQIVMLPNGSDVIRKRATTTQSATCLIEEQSGEGTMFLRRFVAFSHPSDAPTRPPRQRPSNTGIAPQW